MAKTTYWTGISNGTWGTAGNWDANASYSDIEFAVYLSGANLFVYESGQVQTWL